LLEFQILTVKNKYVEKKNTKTKYKMLAELLLAWLLVEE